MHSKQQVNKVPGGGHFVCFRPEKGRVMHGRAYAYELPSKTFTDLVGHVIQSKLKY